LSPNLSSHDWHVQPICQRPNRLPPERRAFSPERICSYAQAVRRRHSCPRPTSRARTRNPSVLETLKVTGSGACCQPIVPTGFPPFMHIFFLGRLGSSTRLSFISFMPFVVVDSPPRTQGSRRSGALLRATERNFRLRSSTFSAAAEAEVSKLDKRSCGGSCDERQNPSRILVPE